MKKLNKYQKTESHLTIPSCPIPISDYPHVLLAHGGGGRLMHQLIEKMFVSAFSNPLLETRHDGAILKMDNENLAFTTDSYVVHPIFFPGGDIGSLAVHGTVNDLAMCGARPMYLSCGFILEEGLPMEQLWKIIQSMKKAADIAHVQIVTGDTKVVPKGKGDGVYINTAGVGVIEHSLAISPKKIQSADVILINGDIGRHGMAIMAKREGLEFESTIESDSAPLANLVLKLLDKGIEIHCMRDITRGGLASVLNEMTESSGLGISINESDIPVQEDVKAACEILGFDPMHVACEGRFAAFIAPQDASRALEIMKNHILGIDASIIGTMNASSKNVVMKTKIGTHRIVDMMSGEQLPRIC